MSIVVGFVPTNEGKAALRRAAEEAKLRSTRLVVINSNRGGKDLASDDAVRYEHPWEVGDLIVWDNLALQHGRRDFPNGERRSLRRFQIGA